MLRPDWSASSAPEIRSKAELIVPMMASGGRARQTVFEDGIAAQRADALDHGDIGASGGEDAPEDGEVSLRVAGLASNFDAARGAGALELAIQRGAAERELF